MIGDLARLQGTWHIASLEIEGTGMPAGGSITIEGDRFTTAAMGAEYCGTIEIDASKRPKRFDLLFSAGPELGNRSLGIYQLDGDTWKICLTIAGNTRPTAFATAPGSGHALESLVRGAAVQAEAERAAVKSAPLPAGADDLSGEWVMVDAMQMGHHLDASMVRNARRVATHRETSTYFGQQLYMRAEYTVDPSTHPKRIDFVHTAGTSKGKTQLGIYEIDGPLLRLCFGTPGGPRPADFETRPGDGRTLAVWKRVTAAEAGA